MRGRDSLADHALECWVDEGLVWLREQFREKDLTFSADLDIDKRKVSLTVQKRVQAAAPLRSFHYETVFEVTERVESFVSQLTVTKIILVAG